MNDTNRNSGNEESRTSTRDLEDTIRLVVEEVVESSVKDIVKRTIEDSMSVFLDQLSVEKVEKRKNPGLLDSQMGGWFSNKTDELFTGFKIEPDDTVLDVGCGDGGHLRFCGKRGATLICVEQDETALKKAVEAAQATEAKAVHYFLSDAKPLPLEDGSVNRIICNEVLEHVDDPVEFMQELVRVGSSGAKYLLGVPDHTSENVFKALAWPGYFEKPNHIRIFQRQEFDELVTKAGLVIEHKKYYGFYWSMWWFLFWALDADSEGGEEPLLKSWANTWDLLIKCHQGKKVKDALDALAPKSQLIVAYKP